MKLWLRFAWAGCCIAALTAGCGGEEDAPVERESIVIEEPEPGSNGPPKEGKLPEKLRK